MECSDGEYDYLFKGNVVVVIRFLYENLTSIFFCEIFNQVVTVLTLITTKVCIKCYFINMFVKYINNITFTT